MKDPNENRPGYKKTKVGWIPNKWECRAIGQFAKTRSGATPSRSEQKYWGGNIPWATTTAVNYGTVTETEENITELALQETSTWLVPRGTVVMAMYGQGATRGRVAIIGREMAINQACLAIIPRNGSVRGRFLYHLLTHDYGRIRNYSQGGNQENLSGDLVEGIPLALPTDAEQEKIESVFDSWDDAAIQTRDLITGKKRRRKGLMQQLLSGNRRLPGFAGDWKKTKVGSLYEEVERPVVWDDEATYSLLSVRRASGGVFLREEQQGKSILTKSMYTAKSGDFLISKMQVLHGATALVPEQFDGMHISGSYIALRPQEGAMIDPEYFALLSATPEFYHLTYLSSYGVHIEKMTFNLKWFLDSTVEIPADLDEQKAIVAVIKAADEEIAAEESRLLALQDQKRGLMQKLLTGEVRVKV